MPGKTGFIQALFNDESCSDLTLIVADQRFYCHKVVMQRACQYPQFEKWPRKESGAKSEIKIDLPDIQLPDKIRPEPNRTKSSWFKKYLSLVYDLQDLQSPAEAFAVAQVANFMISPKISDLCDELLSSTTYNRENVLIVLIFCQKYSLPKTIQTGLKLASNNFPALVMNPLLNHLDPLPFKQLIIQSYRIPQLQFLGTLCYASRVVYRPGIKTFRIESDEMRKLSCDIFSTISQNWTRSVVNDIYRSFKDAEVVCSCSKSDRFLYKIFSDCYFRLDDAKSTQNYSYYSY